MTVVLLSGGSGGAKLARGLYEVLGDDLHVIANTADDVELYGAHISPDPDLIAYWLADMIDQRGFGIAGDSFNVMAGLRELGAETWFELGDRDLAACIERRRLLEAGISLTEALAHLTAAHGVRAHVLAMCETPVRTHIRSDGRWVGLQEFLIQGRGAWPIEEVEFRGAAEAEPAPAALEAIAAARSIVIGPSNPVISIDPILSIPGMRDALANARAPVVAVSPIVGGEVLKGPTEAFLQWAGRSCDAGGVAAHYAGLIDGLVADEPATGLPALQTTTLMDDPPARRALAEQTLAFCETLR